MKLPLVPRAVTHIPADVRQEATGLSASGGAGRSGLGGRAVGKGRTSEDARGVQELRQRRRHVISCSHNGL